MLLTCSDQYRGDEPVRGEVLENAAKVGTVGFTLNEPKKFGPHT